MTPDDYIKSVIAKHSIASDRSPASEAAANAVYEIIKTWAHQFLLEVRYSGSRAKGTAIVGTSDVDLFISLKPETPGTLEELYNGLATYQGLAALSPRRQNVSIVYISEMIRGMRSVVNRGATGVMSDI